MSHSPPCGVPWRPEWELTTLATVPTHYVDARFTVWPTKRPNTSVGLCLLPKAGSSTLKRALFAALVRQRVPVRPDFDVCPHRQPAVANLATPARAYIFVRHPSTRLASAYREVARRGLWHRLPTQQPNTSFAAAVHSIVRAPDPMRLNLHFRPVLHTCGLLEGKTYTVLRYEDWDGLVAVLKRDFALRDVQYRASGTEQRAHRMYTRALAQTVNEWSQLDRLLLGYDAWLPGQSISWHSNANLGTRMRTRR